MRGLQVPVSPQAHLDGLVERLGPLAAHPHWQALARYVLARHAPLFYQATEASEDQNLSNWFGLVNERVGSYARRSPVRALYFAHELSHLVLATPHAATADAFADAFEASERLASYETELRVYDDLPALAETVPFRPLLAAVLARNGVDLADHRALMAWREAVIAQPGLLTEPRGEGERMASYRGTREWALDYWRRLEALGWWSDPIPFLDDPVTLDGYRTEIAHRAEAPLEVAAWERLVADNVRRAYRLCGLPDPAPGSLDDARDAATALDGCVLVPEVGGSPS